MYFDLKTHYKLSMSPVNINCMMILKEEEVQEEITVFCLYPLWNTFKNLLRINICQLII